MSASKDDHASDDEFHEALPHVIPLSASSEGDAAVEELIKQQKDLKLPDDDGFMQKAVEVGGEEYVQASAVPIEPDDTEDFIDEEELREREKSMSAAELEHNKEEADKLKLKGNELFKQDNANEAIEVYNEALKLCPTTCSKERAILYGNRAACKIKVDAKKSAIEDCSKAIELYPQYVRALLRRAKLLEGEDKLDDALVDYKKVYDLDPGQREAREAMVRLPPIINERNERMKEEMIGKLKDLGNLILRPFGLSTANFQMQQDPNSGGYSINFNQKQS